MKYLLNQEQSQLLQRLIDIAEGKAQNLIEKGMKDIAIEIFEITEKFKALEEYSEWHETHFEVVSAISIEAYKNNPSKPVKECYEASGTGGLYELAEELTNEFQSLHTGREWDGEYFDEIEKFLQEKLELPEPKEKFTYFLFGSQLVKDYLEDFNEVPQSISDGRGILYIHKESEGFSSLLNAVDGWENWAQITEEEYKIITDREK